MTTTEYLVEGKEDVEALHSLYGELVGCKDRMFNMFNGWKSYYKFEPVVENDITFYKIEFPLKTKWDVYEKVGEKVGVKLGERLGVKLGENEEKILSIIIENKFITSAELSEKVTVKVPEKVTVKVPEAVVKLGEKIGGQEGGQEGGQILTHRQKEIFDLIKQNPMLTREELSSKLKINQSATQKHIEKIKQKGLIKRVGPDKGGHWEIVK